VSATIPYVLWWAFSSTVVGISLAWRRSFMMSIIWNCVTDTQHRRHSEVAVVFEGRKASAFLYS
jgi:hypothetical protein